MPRPFWFRTFSSWRRFSVLIIAIATALHAAPDRHVLFVTLDGLRWQDVFRGADEALINAETGGVPDSTAKRLRDELLAGTAEERRRKLMPFLWTEVGARGQIFGNRDRGSTVQVANAEWFSYPGYNELFCGFADPLITSNAPIPNRNVTVFEWLNQRPSFAGRVAACVTWHVLPAALNVGRSRLPVWVSAQNPALAARSPRWADIDRWMRDIPLKAGDEHYDGFAFHAALEMINVVRPRVLYVAFGEPDTNAHRRRYDAYLESITRCDRFMRELWEALESRAEYRGKTTLVVTTDHGRGMTGSDWINHNKKTPGSNETWLAVLGPGTPARGERGEHAPIVSAQVAATLAALVGEDYARAEPKAAPAIADVLDRR